MIREIPGPLIEFNSAKNLMPDLQNRTGSIDDRLKKRIRRRVTGRIQEFFIVVAPGLENIVADELRKPPLSRIQGASSPGGIAFSGRLEDLYIAALHLRCASRILMRLTTFRATNFRSLVEKINAFDWELFLPACGLPRIHAVSSHSRLYHQRAVSDRITEIIARRLDVPEGLSDQRLFVRIADDIVTVSLDACGDLLYKRGIKRHAHRAPIRETLAAGALMLAGYTGSVPLIDPMCGSGTFSLEAALIAANIPPGWFRNFSFMRWPAFQPGRWNFIKKEAQKGFAARKSISIFASDIDADACSRLQECVAAHGFSNVVSVEKRDFFSLCPEDLTKEKGVVAINPPYGLRLENPETSRRLFREICAKLKSDYRGWTAVLIVPEFDWASRVPFRCASMSFPHGGLRPTLLWGRIE